MKTLLQIEAADFAASVKMSPDTPAHWEKCIRTAIELGYTAGVNATIRQIAERPAVRIIGNDDNNSTAA